MRKTAAIPLPEPLNTPDKESADDRSIAAIRQAAANTNVDVKNVLIVDNLPHHVVSQTRNKIIHLNRARLKNASPEEIEHRLRHEEAHRCGIYDCGLVELSISAQNSTGKIYYPKKQEATKRAIAILDPADGIRKAVILYKQRKFQHLYDMFFFAASKKGISRNAANKIFRAAFPKLASTKRKLYREK